MLFQGPRPFCIEILREFPLPYESVYAMTIDESVYIITCNWSFHYDYSLRAFERGTLQEVKDKVIRIPDHVLSWLTTARNLTKTIHAVAEEDKGTSTFMGVDTSNKKFTMSTKMQGIALEYILATLPHMASL